MKFRFALADRKAVSVDTFHLSISQLQFPRFANQLAPEAVPLCALPKRCGKMTPMSPDGLKHTAVAVLAPPQLLTAALLQDIYSTKTSIPPEGAFT